MLSAAPEPQSSSFCVFWDTPRPRNFVFLHVLDAPTALDLEFLRVLDAPMAQTDVFLRAEGLQGLESTCFFCVFVAPKAYLRASGLSRAEKYAFSGVLGSTH